MDIEDSKPDLKTEDIEHKVETTDSPTVERIDDDDDDEENPVSSTLSYLPF